MSADGDKNKIAQSLSPKDLEEFVDECWHLSGLTLAKIQELAAKRGIAISLMAATSFRDTTFARHLARIRRAREMADQVKELKRSGGSLADAAGELLSQEVMDVLTRERSEDGEDGPDLEALSLIVSRLRMGDARRDAVKMRQMDVAKAAIEKAAQIKAITSDTKIESGARLERVRQLLFGELATEEEPA